jgi:small subunit ribosomal protein S3Ae
MSQQQKSKKKARGKVIDKWKQKGWYEVYAPKTFNEAFLGAIPCDSENPDYLMGRIIEVLLYDLTGNMKHTFIKLKFKITETVGNRCNTRLWGHELTRDFIRSLIHRGSSRVDGIFNYTTADGFVYRVSTFVVTRRRAKRSQKETMRKIIFQVLNEFAANMTHDKFVRGIIYGKFANNIRRIAKSIYPLRECQIRKVKVVSMPEGVGDETFTVDEDEIDEVNLQLPEHGKTVKAKKAHRRKEQKEDGDASPEGEETEGAPESADNPTPSENPEEKKE